MIEQLNFCRITVDTQTLQPATRCQN